MHCPELDDPEDPAVASHPPPAIEDRPAGLATTARATAKVMGRENTSAISEITMSKARFQNASKGDPAVWTATLLIEE